MFHELWIQLIRFAFWTLYNPLAWSYDLVSRLVSNGLWHDWQRAALSELRGERILELAFGTGNVLLDLSAAHYTPVGLELSPAMMRIAQRKLAAHGLALPLVRGRAQELPFAGSSFDSVLSTFPAGFIASPETLSEIARVLRPGGRAVMLIVAQLETTTRRSRLLEWLYRVTGQRGPFPDLRPELAGLGLDYRALWKPVGRSAVMLALAEKQVDN
jgi:ubiquinone/menaquinone biosynthesis C-methylase UbiE